LQASAYHPEHGIVVAVPFEQFDGSQYYDPSYVRNYRSRMLQCIQADRPGFGLGFEPHQDIVSVQHMAANVVVYRSHLADKLDLCHTVVVTEDGEMVQLAEITNAASVPVSLPYVLSLKLSLNRASYGQLTEGGPVPLPRSQNVLRKETQHVVSVENPHLGARLLSSLAINGKAVDLSGVQEDEAFDAPLTASVAGHVTIQPGDHAAFRASFRLVPELKYDIKLLQSSHVTAGRDHHQATTGWLLDHAPTTYILRRNVDYILANCTIPVTRTAVAIITDHVALPLGWNRDNYWQIRLLLETYANLDLLVQTHTATALRYAKQIRRATKGHLNWMFKHAKRPCGYWDRSYLVNGRPKDRCIFQLDQQCYPLLELCDYLDYFPEDFMFVKGIAESSATKQVLGMLEKKRDVGTGLWPTDETPGDDGCVYPYHFSSHVLLWKTFTRLQELFARLGITDAAEHLDEVGKCLWEDTMNAFTYTDLYTGKKTFAYLTDGNGKHQQYHDANDVATFFAREWGFLTTTDELQTWRNTMEFGLSPANKDGYSREGRYEGLGSVHSPGAWSLGYFQELAYAAWAEDTKAMQSAWAKTMAAMQWDGTFSEAVDPQTGACTSKAWFSWPGSMLGVLIVKMRSNGQERILLHTA
jgi:hypothetical protein